MSEDDTGINIKADLTPVIAATPNAMRALFNMLFGKKHMNAERMIQLASAQNGIDEKKIKSGEARFDFTTNELITDNAFQSKYLIAEQIQNQEMDNLIACSIKSLPYIKENPALVANDEQIEFADRWKSEAKNRSTEAAQAIWARILAEEINLPGSISLRTLEVIKNLSQKEARYFETACKYIAFNKYVVINTQNEPLDSDILETLKDAGLLSSFSESMYETSGWQDLELHDENGSSAEAVHLKFGGINVYLDKKFVDQPKLDSLEFCHRELTSAGKELYRVIYDPANSGRTEFLQAFKGILPDALRAMQFSPCNSFEGGSLNINTACSMYPD